MTKIKKLKPESSQPPKSAETKEPIVIEGPKKIQVRIVGIEVFNATLAYLGTQPHNQVANLLNSLSQSPVADATVGPAPAQPEGTVS